MFHKLPPLHALAAFEAAARHQSFANAARELCITQSAISYRIRLLEQHYGARFFLRTGRSVTLTAEGNQFLTTVLNALSLLDAASARFLDKSRKKVRVSVGLAFASNWLVPHLADFYSKVQGVDLEILANKATDRDRLSDLKAGEADISIRSAKPQEWPGYAVTKLLDSEVFPVCSPSYRDSAGGLREPADLAKAVILRQTTQSWSPWLSAAGLSMEEPKEGPAFSSSGMALDAAISGHGVALGRSVLVSRHLATGRLVRLFDISIPSDTGLYAIYLPHAMARSEAMSFLNWITDACVAE